MTILSPTDALQRIVNLCSTVPMSGPQLRLHVLEVARAGLAMAVPMPPESLPCWTIRTVREGLNALLTEAQVEGRHYLPTNWVRTVATRGLAMAEPAELTPVQRQADQLLDVAIKCEACLASFVPGSALLMELSTVLDPLRPLDSAIEQLLVAAQEEQVIDRFDAGKLRCLARKLAK